MEDISNRSLKITRTFDAPVELFWDVITTPDHIKEWWGPEGFSNTIRTMDFYVGGKWDFTMHGPDGTDYENLYTVSEIIPMKRLVLVHQGEPKFTIEVDIHGQGTQTTVDWCNIWETAPSMEEAIRSFKVDSGLVENINRLGRYVNNVAGMDDWNRSN